MPDVLPLVEGEARREGHATYDREPQAFNTDVGLSNFAGRSSSPNRLVADPKSGDTSPATFFNDASVLRADTYGKTFVSGHARAIVGSYEHHEHHYHYQQQPSVFTPDETNDEQNRAFINTVLNAAAQYQIPLPSKTTHKDPRSISRWVADVIEAHICAPSLADGQMSDIFPSHASSKAVLATSASSSSAASFVSVKSTAEPDLGHCLDDLSIQNVSKEDYEEDKEYVAMSTESLSTTLSHQRAGSQDQRSQVTRSMDALRENLLGELTIEPSKISKPVPSKPPSILSIGTADVTEKLRLVIGIDYGTRFTGRLKHIFVSLTSLT